MSALLKRKYDMDECVTLIWLVSSKQSKMVYMVSTVEPGYFANTHLHKGLRNLNMQYICSFTVLHRTAVQGLWVEMQLACFVSQEKKVYWKGMSLTKEQEWRYISLTCPDCCFLSTVCPPWLQRLGFPTHLLLQHYGLPARVWGGEKISVLESFQMTTPRDKQPGNNQG